MLYPLKFVPILKERIWGGDRLTKSYEKADDDGKLYGESWELSGVKGDVSVVENGELQGLSLTDLIEKFGAELLGERVAKQFGSDFPLLIKLIDARDDLSVQVHPNDEWAKKRHDCFGKNEMWYIVDAAKGAKLYLGFKRKVSRQEYVESLESGRLTDILRSVEVKAGDSFYIPAGLVHAIGAGTLIAEIQQTSDITYRLFDWNRVDDKGCGRELHTELALDVIDFAGDDVPNLSLAEGENLATTPYFTTNKITLDGALRRDYSSLDSFVILMVVEGQVRINDVMACEGETVLIPSSVPCVEIEGKATLIESRV